MRYRELLHTPVHDALQRLGFDGSTGVADGRQRPPSPVLHTALPQRAHQETIRCADEIHMAGLPLAAAHLTVSQPQLLLAVSMKGLGPCPAMAIDQYYTNDFPPQPVTDQRFTGFRVLSLAPKQHDAHGVRHVGNPHLFAEVPIPRTAHAHGFFRLPGNLPGHLLEFLLSASIDNLAVQLQVPHIRALLALDVVEELGAGKIAIKGKIPWNGACEDRKS